jgi:hypothetical protein
LFRNLDFFVLRVTSPARRAAFSGRRRGLDMLSPKGTLVGEEAVRLHALTP